MPKRPGLKFSTASPSLKDAPPSEESERVFISGRVPTVIFRQFKSLAGLKGRTVQDLLEEAMTEYLVNHR